jgi:acyl-CoA synthetase (AMP-forming)/AMP-acid ligase II
LLRGAKRSARLPRLKSLTVRSSPVSEKLREGLQQFVSPNTWIAYGTNEFGTASVALPGDQQGHSGSIGPALPGVRLEIVDKDDSPLPVGEVGNIRMQASGMFSGYLDSIEETAAALKDGWFYPKDLGSHLLISMNTRV